MANVRSPCPKDCLIVECAIQGLVTLLLTLSTRNTYRLVSCWNHGGECHGPTPVAERFLSINFSVGSTLWQMYGFQNMSRPAAYMYVFCRNVHD